MRYLAEGWPLGLTCTWARGRLLDLDDQTQPLRYVKTSPEIIRLVVMLYIRYPLSLRNVEDPLHDRGIEIRHESVRFCWDRFGPTFAAKICGRRVEVENSDLTLRRRKRAMLRYRRMRTLQRLASVHASDLNHFPTGRQLQNRDICQLTCAAALVQWRGVRAARRRGGAESCAS